MKRPLVRLALLYGGGLQLADSIPLPLWPILLLTFLTSLLALTRSSLRPGLLPLALLLLGASNLTQSIIPYRSHDLRNLTPAVPKDVHLRGRLLKLSCSPDPSQSGRGRCTAELDTTAIRLGPTSWQPACGRVLVSCPDLLSPLFKRGCSVQVDGVIQPPPRSSAPGLFDYQAHLQRHGIYRSLRTQNPNDWRLMTISSPLSQRFRDWAQRTLARGLPEDDPAVALLRAMTLGWRTGLTGEVSLPFMRSGTIHVFAVSGLHILLITLILTTLLRCVRLPRPACAAVLLPTLWFYAAVTEWQASAVRSIMMTSVVLVGWLLKRPGDLLNSLAAAALLLLLWEPQQWFQVGFQLSFAVVLCLILLEPALQPLRQLAIRPDSLVPRQTRSRWRRAQSQIRIYLAKSTSTSLAAWLGSLPIIAFYFHYFTPISILANLLVVPLSGLALSSAMGSLLTGAWLPALSEVFNHSAWLWMRTMMSISKWTASLPGAWFHVAWPGLSAMALYYTSLAGLAAGWFLRSKTRPRILAAVLVLALWTGMDWHAKNALTQLFILPTQSGATIYVKDPRSPRHLLIDCGAAEAVQYVVAPFLRAQGLNTLPVLLLTHGDHQHIAGTSMLASHVPIQQLCLGPTRFRSATYRALQQEWEPTGRLRILQPGQQVGPWTILHPAPEDRFSRADDAALVLLATFHKTRVLLCSDLGRAGQRTLLERYPGLQADILIGGLPTADEALSPLFLEAIQPRLVIVADNLLPARERAPRSLQQRLASQQVPVVYTHETGALTLSFPPRRLYQIQAHHSFPLAL